MSANSYNIYSDLAPLEEAPESSGKHAVGGQNMSPK